MIKSKWIDRICCITLAAILVLTVLFMHGGELGLTAAARPLGYENRLFDQSKVHTIDLVVDNWEDFLETCTDEEYIVCDLVIDGEAVRNVGLRAKGNTSLTSVANYGNDRYSFKIEIDHYDSTKSYHGLDKFCLNNIIQDNTYLKDYLTYTMMGDMGVASPLCSYAYITVNGEDWGLYLAVEAVEESFLTRNYGADYGNLYKPDTMDNGGGRGNGRNFDMEQWEQPETENSSEREFSGPQDNGFSFETVKAVLEEQGIDTSSLPEDLNLGEESPEALQNILSDLGIDMQDLMRAFADGGLLQPGWGQEGGREGGRNFGGMGSSDTKLQYIDDNPESYANIFDSAKTDISPADEKRLIESLKNLSEGENIDSVVNVETVIRYFAVHDFVQNGDSYTGSMVHNYYLYEKDGQMEMIPWDYNLAFGGFGAGGFGSEASGMTSTVNAPIDSPVSGGELSDRPMAAWIFADDAYTSLYHQIYQEFITSWFDSGKCARLIDETTALIAPYVQKDPTAFCSYDAFEKGAETLKEFCLLRAESVQGQLDGIIPSTSAGQAADSSTLIDASALSASDMGSMNRGAGGQGDFGGKGVPDETQFEDGEMPDGGTGMRTELFSEEGKGRDAFGGGNKPDDRNGPPEMPGVEQGGKQPLDSSIDKEGLDNPPEEAGVREPFGGSDEEPLDAEGSPGIPAGSIAWIGGSVLVLLAGLLFLKLYRRNI